MTTEGPDSRPQTPESRLGDWWQTAFDAQYLTTYAHRDDAQAAAEVAGLLPRLRAAPGPVLDACCGAGRHSQALRVAGLTVLGFDWSMDLLRAAAERPTVRRRIARGDMRQPPFAGGFGAVVLLFTAFGYFDDQQNSDCLGAFAGLLAPGGWLVLDLAEPTRLRANLVPSSRRTLADGTVLDEVRWLDGQRVCKDLAWTPLGADRPVRTAQERVRLYERDELAALAESHGLTLEDAWPSLAGPDQDQGRLVAWLRKTPANP